MVMLAAGHAQAGVDRGHVFVWALACCHGFEATPELGHVAAGLGLTPMCVGVADDGANVGFGS